MELCNKKIASFGIGRRRLIDQASTGNITFFSGI
jgi:hypothetical protein